jgi:hypothetical protein
MAFQAIPNGVEVLLAATLAGQVCNNTLFFTHAGAWGVDEMQALADAVDDAWGSFVSTYMYQDYHYDQTIVTDKRTDTALQAFAFANAGSGGVTGAPVPNNVAISVKRQSAFTGRSARGRVYIPVGAESHLVSTNVVTDAFAAAATAALQAISDAADDVDWTAVIVSRVHDGVTLPEAVVYTIVEWIVVDKVIDSMRRRLPGRGD